MGASRLVSAGRGTGSAARFGWQAQHLVWPPPLLDAARRQAQHLGASRLVSAGRGSTSGSGRCPSAFRGPMPGAALGSLAALGLAPPLLDAARRSTWEPRGSFLLAGAALQAPARRSTWEPRGSFLLAGAALQALDGPERVSGPPALMS